MWWGIPKGYVPFSLSWHFFNFVSSLNGKMPGKPDWCSKACTLDREIPDLLWICYMLHFKVVSNIIMQFSSFYFSCFLLVSNPALTSTPTSNCTFGTESHTKTSTYHHICTSCCTCVWKSRTSCTGTYQEYSKTTQRDTDRAWEEESYKRDPRSDGTNTEGG